MGPFWYLLKTQLKNSLKSLKKNPAKLIGYLCILLFLGLSIITNSMGKDSQTEAHQIRSMEELGCIIMAFFMLVAWPSLKIGLDKGTTFFKMPDVNLLFTAPFDPKKVLIYGLINQMGTNVFVSLFIFYQIPFLNNVYGVKPIKCLAIFIAYLVMLCITQLMCMAIYMYTQSHAKRKQGINALLYLLLIVPLLIMSLQLLRGEKFLTAIINGFEYLTYLPYIGWIKGILYSYLIGAGGSMLLYSLLLLGGLLLLGAYIIKSSVDYYEDVLTQTEYTQAVMENMKTGRGTIDTGTKVKSEKLRKVGLGRGQGASTLFFKQMLESNRHRRFILGIGSLIEMVLVIGGTFFLNRIEDIPKLGSLLMIVGIMTYMQLLLSAKTRWSGELRYHYIYLIPVSGFTKLIFSCLEGVLKTFLEALLIYTPSILLLGLSPLYILVCVLVKVSFEVLLISINVLSQRVFGTVANSGLLMILFLMAGLIFTAPGIIGGVIVGFMVNQTGELVTAFLPLLIIALWNSLIGGGIALASNSIFSQMELNTRS